MLIIEIKELDNGGHRNQVGTFKNIPTGWAVVPESMTLDNFPFGKVKAKKVDGVMTVTSWEAGAVPEQTPVPEVDPVENITTADMAAAIKEGVDAI